MCEKITEKVERIVCELALEAKEKGITFEELYKQKVQKLEGKEEDPNKNLFLDILVSPDDEKVTGKTYAFEASLDPSSQIPQNPRYRFVFEDGHSINSSNNRIERTFKNPGRYQYTVTLYDLSTDKVVIKKMDNIDLIKGEKEEEKKEDFQKLLREDECEEDAESCIESCNNDCEQKKYDYCRKYEYSGCALDVFCWCNACTHVYNKRWCGISEKYIGCAVGALGKYKSCIENCNSEREANQDVTTCGGDCNTEMFETLGNPCKDPPCKEFCKQQGYDDGVWAKYTGEYGWDSCACTKKE